MTPRVPAPTARLALDAAALMAAYPPRVHHPNKQVVLDLACLPGALHRGHIDVTRWGPMDLPATVAPGARDGVLVVPGYFRYGPAAEPDGVEWHVNFADPNLFGYHAGGLFAQDELQVAEHPALAAVREALAAAGIPARTVDATGPTPVLVAGVERRVAIATGPDPAAGRPHGLYGNRFAAATADVVRGATTVIDPPTLTNVVAMAALPGGRGAYTDPEIRTTLVTAFTAFRAAVLESDRLRAGAATVVHTGYWGGGAFGGDRVLMVLLQAVAARMAGLRELVVHTGPTGGEGPAVEAVELLDALAGTGPVGTEELLAAIIAHGFRWGTGDGN